MANVALVASRQPGSIGKLTVAGLVAPTLALAGIQLDVPGDPHAERQGKAVRVGSRYER